METIDVKHIAKLAKLSLEEEKVPLFQKQMQDVVGLVDKLPAIEGKLEIDTDNVMELRKDEILPSLNRDALLSNAPHAVAGCVVVPQTMES